jgi:tetratricopeptide (TPR) repeat protein
MELQKKAGWERPVTDKKGAEKRLARNPTLSRFRWTALPTCWSSEPDKRAIMHQGETTRTLVVEKQWEQLVAGVITPAEFIGLTPNQLYRIARVGYQLLNSGKLEEAKKVYQGLVAADPCNSVFHCHLAAVHHRLGASLEAVMAYTEALRFNIANSEALAGRGEIYLHQCRFEEAIRDLTEALRLDPQGERATTIRARSLLLALKQGAEKASS